jgi:hypothetical protein
MPLDPLSGIEVQKVIADIYSAPPNAVQKARELMASTK